MIEKKVRGDLSKIIFIMVEFFLNYILIFKIVYVGWINMEIN